MLAQFYNLPHSLLYIIDVNREFAIAHRKVGLDYPPLVVVEIGINHEGDLSVAKLMVELSKSHDN
jgi:hypothetical protein